MFDWAHLVIALAVFLSGLLATALRFGFLIASYKAEMKDDINRFITKINEQMASQKAEFNAMLELKEAENGKAIGRIYQRFDEYKDHLENNFVRREMCQVTHHGESSALARIEMKQDAQGEKLDALILKVAGMK